jgi:chorismate mutase
MSMMVSGVGIAVSLLVGMNVTDAKGDAPGPLTKLIDDAAQRLQTADPVAASKYVTGGAVDDPGREQQVIESVTGAAEAKQVDSQFVHDVFRDQIDATDSLEHSRFAAWKIDPASAPKAAPDLAASRNTIDKLNTAIVDDIADEWIALHASSCRTDLDHARATVVTMRRLDALYQQALSYAVHRYCR